MYQSSQGYFCPKIFSQPQPNWSLFKELSNHWIRHTLPKNTVAAAIKSLNPKPQFFFPFHRIKHTKRTKQTQEQQQHFKNNSNSRSFSLKNPNLPNFLFLFGSNTRKWRTLRTPTQNHHEYSSTTFQKVKIRTWTTYTQPNPHTATQNRAELKRKGKKVAFFFSLKSEP